jgi:hypothetical protein
MSDHVIWCFGEEVFLVFDHLAHDWCGQFKTRDEAEACADELEHEPPVAVENRVQTREECTQITISVPYY